MLRLLAALACAALLQAQQSPVEQAWALVAKGQRADAIQLLTKAVQSSPGNADARLLLGSLLQEAGRRDACLEQLSAAVKLRPTSAEAQNALGEAYMAFGEPQPARGPFEAAVKLDPRFATARVNLGAVLLDAGEIDKAAAQLDRAIALMGHTPDAAYPLYLRAKAYTSQNQIEQAAAALRQAINLQPDFAEAWSDLGSAQKSLGDDTGALDDFRRAADLKPDDSVAQTRLAAEYLSLGQAHQAVPHFQAALQSAPEDQSALNGLQRALREDGQEQQANAVKKRLVDLLRAKDKADQDSLTAIRLNNEGANLEKARNLRGALDKYRSAHQLFPGHVGIQVNYAIALLRLGEWKEGLAQLRDAAQREPGDPKLKAALDDALRQAPVEFGGLGQSRSPSGYSKDHDK